VYFDYNYESVLNEVTLKVMLTLWVTDYHYTEVSNIQATFLHGNLEEDMILEVTEGYQEYLGEC
jgi:hypothetical protein